MNRNSQQQFSDTGDNESEISTSANQRKKTRAISRKSSSKPQAPTPSNKAIVTRDRESRPSFTATASSSVIARVRRVISDCKRVTANSTATNLAASDGLLPAQTPPEAADPKQFVDQLKQIVDEGHATLDEHEAAVVASYLRVFAESWATHTQQTADEIERLERELARKRADLTESKTRLRAKQERLASVIDLSTKASSTSTKQKNAKQTQLSAANRRRLAQLEIPQYVSAFLLYTAHRTVHELYIDQPRKAIETVIVNLRQSTEHIQSQQLTEYQQQLKSFVLAKKDSLARFVAERETKIDRVLPLVKSREAHLATAAEFVKIIQQEIRRIKATVRGGRAYILEAKHQQPALGNCVHLRQQEELIVPTTASKTSNEEVGDGDYTEPLTVGQRATNFFRTILPFQSVMATDKSTDDFDEEQKPGPVRGLDGGVRELIKATRRVAHDVLHGSESESDDSDRHNGRKRTKSRKKSKDDLKSADSHKNWILLNQSRRMLRTRRQTIVCRTLIACLDSVSDIFKLDVQTLYTAIDACKQQRHKAAEDRAACVDVSRRKSRESKNALLYSASSSGKLLLQKPSRHFVAARRRASLSTSRIISKLDSQTQHRRTFKLKQRDRSTSTRAEDQAPDNGGGDAEAAAADADDVELNSELDFRDTATKLYKGVLNISSSSPSSSAADDGPRAAPNPKKLFVVGSMELDNAELSYHISVPSLHL